MKKVLFFLLISSFATLAYSEENSRFVYGEIQTIRRIAVDWSRLENEKRASRCNFSTSFLPTKCISSFRIPCKNSIPLLSQNDKWPICWYWAWPF